MGVVRVMGVGATLTATLAVVTARGSGKNSTWRANKTRWSQTGCPASAAQRAAIRASDAADRQR